MVTTVLGILVIVLGLICWLGQTLVVFAPRVAEKLGVGEPEEELDQSMYLFERFSQGIMDILLTRILPASALDAVRSLHDHAGDHGAYRGCLN